MKQIVFISLAFCFIFSGCTAAKKVKELGGGISNINHPIAFALGATIYKTGKSLENSKEVELKEEEPQTFENEDLEVKF